MPKLTHSSIGQSREVAPTKKPQNYVVEDTSTGLDARMAQFEEPAETPIVNFEAFPLPPPKPVSKDLEKLIFIGRLTEIVDLGGTKFEISSLTNREYNEILKTLYRFKEPSDLFTIRIVTLANCLRKIDGVALDDLEIEGEFESDFHRRMSLIDNLQLSIVEKLYAAYEKLVEVKAQAEEEVDQQVKN